MFDKKSMIMTIHDLSHWYNQWRSELNIFQRQITNIEISQVLINA